LGLFDRLGKIASRIIDQSTQVTLEQSTPVETMPSNQHCPYCCFQFLRMPTRKRKCPSCHNLVYVKTRPSNRQKQLVTESQAVTIDREWKKYHDENYLARKLSQYGATEEERRTVETELTKQFGFAPKLGDVLWRIANNRIVAASAQSDWQTLCQTYWLMA